MKNILLTGAGGFIGSHLADRLVTMGLKVRVLSHYNSRHDLGNLNLLERSVFNELDIFSGDLMDADAVRTAIKGCDTVFHLGALIGIPYSYQNPNHVFLTNTQGTLNVLLAARDLGTERVVHTSTSEVYGTARIIPINEDHPLQAQSPYSASKIAADKIAESFFCSFNTPVVTVRPFNTYGPRQSARAVIPTIISQALVGGEIKLGMLDSRRDFTYVSDTVNGFVLAAQTAGIEGNVFNLGVGQDNTVGKIAEMIFKIIKEKKGAGFEAEIQQDANRIRPERSEVMRLISDNSKAKKQLGWQPQVTLEQGLDQTVQWIDNHPHLFRTGVYEV